MFDWDNEAKRTFSLRDDDDEREQQDDTLEQQLALAETDVVESSILKDDEKGS